MGINKKKVCIFYMVNQFIVPPAGLPNQGQRKKLNVKHWLSTRKNLLRQEVFVIWSARSILKMKLGPQKNVVCKFVYSFLSVWMGFLKSRFLQIPGCQKSCSYLGRLQEAFVCWCLYDYIYCTQFSTVQCAAVLCTVEILSRCTVQYSQRYLYPSAFRSDW